jgi:hypothetical protein
MKIKDIISEAPGGYQQGKAAMTKLLSPSKWLDNTKFKQDYNRGHDAMSKAMSPSKWFSGSNDAASAKHAPQYSIRQSLVAAGTGKKLYGDDVTVLKQAYSDIQSGKIKTNIDANQLLVAIKSAYSGQQLADNQKQMLIQFSKQF